MTSPRNSRFRPYPFPAWLAPAGLATLIFATLAMRFVNLGVKPVMHDESLFAYYSYVAMKAYEQSGTLRDTYPHMPLMHGPTLMLATALFFHWFGDSIALARGWIALGSLAMLAGALGLWPRRMRWPLAVLMAASPTLLYYSRFFRNDVLFCAVATVGVLGVSRGLSRRRGHVIWSVAGTALLIGLINLMENALFIYAAGATFGSVYGALRLWARWSPATYRGLRGLRAPRHRSSNQTKKGARKIPAHERRRAAMKKDAGESAEANGEPAPAGGGSLWDWKGWPSFWGWLAGATLGITFVALIYGHLAGQAITPNPDPQASLVHRLLSKAAYGLGLMNLKASWDYWSGQHSEQRIGGALHYHLPILLTYELPLLLLVYAGLGWDAFRRWTRGALYAAATAAWLIGWKIWQWIGPPAAGDNAGLIAKGLHFLHLEPNGSVLVLGLLIVPLLVWSILQIIEHRPLAAWLGWWAACSLFQYSSAGEKVPWLAVHMALPLYLSVGWIWGPLLARPGRAARNTVLIFAVLGTLIALRSDLRFIGDDEANARERIVYNHTTAAVDRVIKNRLALWKETEDKISPVQRRVLFVDHPLKGGPSWPGFWYFRGYGYVVTTAPETVMDQHWDFVMGTDDAMAPVLKAFAAKGWTEQQLSLRDHWIVDWPEQWRWTAWSKGEKAPNGKNESFGELLGASVRDLWIYYWYRIPWSPPGYFTIYALDPPAGERGTGVAQ